MIAAVYLFAITATFAIGALLTRIVPADFLASILPEAGEFDE